jgi:flavin reductase (DIM6/NTAB) family NADH-FMN oxidoreductase RutF
VKQKLNGANPLYPVPMYLIGSVVEGKPAFMAAAHFGILNASAPWIIAMGITKGRHTAKGVHAHGVFSVNMAAEDQVVITDYCGLVSGTEKDKGSLFTVFNGQLDKAPMIEECRINMECRVTQVLENPTHHVFIADVVETYADESVLNEGAISLERFRPLLFDINSVGYYSLGERVGDCWSIGKQMQE